MNLMQSVDRLQRSNAAGSKLGVAVIGDESGIAFDRVIHELFIVYSPERLPGRTSARQMDFTIC